MVLWLSVKNISKGIKEDASDMIFITKQARELVKESEECIKA